MFLIAYERLVSELLFFDFFPPNNSPARFLNSSHQTSSKLNSHAVRNSDELMIPEVIVYNKLNRLHLEESLWKFMYAMACLQRDYLWKLFHLFAVKNKQYVPTEDRNILPRGYGWSPMSFAIVHIAFRDIKGT